MQIFFFLPMILFMAFFLLLMGGFLFLVFKIISKTKNSYWKGKVTDKLYNTRREDFDDNRETSFYTLVVKTEDGLERKIAVRKDMYDSTKVGDTLEKPKGKLNPVKI